MFTVYNVQSKKMIQFFVSLVLCDRVTRITSTVPFFLGGGKYPAELTLAAPSATVNR